MFNLFKKETKPVPIIREYFVSHGTNTTNILANSFQLNINERYVIFMFDGEIVSVFTDLKSFYLVSNAEALNETEN